MYVNTMYLHLSSLQFHVLKKIQLATILENDGGIVANIFFNNHKLIKDG